MSKLVRPYFLPRTTWWAASVLILAVSGAMPATAGGAEASGAAFAGRWFAPQSPWNVPVPRNPELLAGSQDFISAFLAAGYRVNINSEVWTPAVIEAPPGAPRCAISEGGWRLEGLPLAPGMETAIEHFAAHGDTDASFCVYSEERRAFYNLFGARIEETAGGRRLRLGAFGVYGIDGSGWWDNSLGPWTGRASGASYCGGLVRRDELGLPDIWHALAFAWPKRLVRETSLAQAFVPPARTTDGSGLDPRTAAPMGARLQLDPALDEERMLALGVKPEALPIARALQRFGAYLVDSSDSVMALYVESSQGRRGTGGTALGPLPRKLLSHARFVVPPPPPELDSRNTSRALVEDRQSAAFCLLPPPQSGAAAPE